MKYSVNKPNELALIYTDITDLIGQLESIQQKIYQLLPEKPIQSIIEGPPTK